MWVPCRDCPMQGCGSFHDKCEQYLEYKAERKKYNDSKYLEFMERVRVGDAIRRMKKRRKKRH